MGLLEAILGLDAPPNETTEHPSDSFLKDILSLAGPAPAASDAARMPPMGGSPDEVMGMPPDIAAKVVGNPSIYPNLSGILNSKQTKVPPRRPLDYLIAAASPLIAGFAQMAMSRRRSDRKANFFSGLAGGGLDVLENEVSRPERMQQAQRQQDIENILLQRKVRGTPLPGVIPGTETGVYQYPGTGETLPGIAPEPKTQPSIETRIRKDAQGNEIQEEYDRKKKVWVPSTRETTQPDASGNPTTMRVPFVSPKQKPAPKRELKVGKDEQYTWVSDDPNVKPQGTGLYRPESDKPTREGDINRAEKHQVNQWAVKALADAHTRLGPKAKPEEYVNEAVETFRKASGTSDKLAEKSSEVATAIRAVGRSVKSEDELAQLVQALLNPQTPQK